MIDADLDAFIAQMREHGARDVLEVRVDDQPHVADAAPFRIAQQRQRGDGDAVVMCKKVDSSDLFLGLLDESTRACTASRSSSRTRKTSACAVAARVIASSSAAGSHDLARVHEVQPLIAQYFSTVICYHPRPNPSPGNSNEATAPHRSP